MIIIPNSLLGKSIYLTLFLLAIFAVPTHKAYASFHSLELCRDSSAFQKRLSSSTKKLEKKINLYSDKNNETNAFAKEIALTKIRFASYSNSNILCGKEGLPRMMIFEQSEHLSQFYSSGLLFLYIAGWIGWVGRKYLCVINLAENAFENEIILNVPKAILIMYSGLFWPINAIKELASGDLVISAQEITISPR